MHFKRLELFGFKSFADRTVLNFEPGITAIVGPNGCGKSNIFDSIRWVLGEQSAKELRGSSMEDVIFNGTESKPSLGFSEVSLTFSNESRLLSIDENEVTITRRLFRSGESEYLINKTTARLKDIQESVMGTGLGSEAYSLIQQGRVDFLVRARPEERRLIIDEASGLSRYKAKKKEAMSKLQDTEDNLLRINDIITEVKRQITSIERQANKARRYKEEFEKLKDMEIRLAKFQLGEFSQKKLNIGQEIQQVTSEEQKFTQELKTFGQLLTNQNNSLTEIVQGINDVHAQEIKLDGQINLFKEQIEFNEERLENLEINARKINEQKNQLIERCRSQQQKIEEIKNVLKNILEDLASNEKALIVKRDHLGRLEKLVRDAKEKIREHEEKTLSLTSQQVNLRNALTDIMKEVQGALARKRRLELETEKVSFEKQEVGEKLDSIQSQITSLEAAIQELDEKKENSLKEAEELKRILMNLERDIDELEKKRLFLKSQKEFIEKLNVQYQDIPDPVIEGRLIIPTSPQEHHTGIIGKVKRFSSLNDSVNPCYEIICETKFIELDPLQVNNKIKEITQEIEILLIQKSDAQKNLQEKSEGLNRIEQEILQKEKSRSILEAQKNDILEEMKKIASEINLAESELKEVRESLGVLKKKEDEFNFQLDTINQDLAWCHLDIKEKQSFIASQLQEKEATTVNIARLEKEIESGREKLKTQRETHDMFVETLDSWLEEIKHIDDELFGQETKKEQYQKEMGNLSGKIQAVKGEKESLKEAYIQRENQKSALAGEINETRQKMSLAQGQLKQLHEFLHAKQLNEKDLQFKEQAIKDRLLQTYKIDIDQDPLIQSLKEESSEIDSESFSKEIALLRKRCDSFGAVNMVAIEEYDELKQRFEFLTKQESDLLEAKSQLANTIHKINRTTREIFINVFNKVNEEFRNYFRLLFGGGEGQLILLDPENVLESGIEVVARPPGKKLQNISLLSGGENSLTAIALIFGIFKVNPSPFCVLDEIDAALDESNVGRFSVLLKEFAKLTQIIIITHNKKTIASADVMYGITMPETGISRIVSVKFAGENRQVNEEVPAGV